MQLYPEYWAGTLAAVLTGLCAWLAHWLILSGGTPPLPRVGWAAAGLAAYCLLLGGAIPLYLFSAQDDTIAATAFSGTATAFAALVLHAAVRLRFALRLSWPNTCLLTVFTPVLAMLLWVVYGFAYSGLLSLAPHP